jgi:small subunit ribosomal protein S18
MATMAPRGRGPGSGPGGGGDDRRGGPGGQQGGKKKFFYRRKRVCKFCVEKIEYIDFKDVKTLQQFIPERGKILPRRISGASCRTPSSAPASPRCCRSPRIDAFSVAP